MPKVRKVLSNGFVANCIRFPAVQKFENRLRFDKVIESVKVGTFLRHSVVVHYHADCDITVARQCYSVIGDKPFLWNNATFNPP